MNQELKQLMIEAIKVERPIEIQRVCYEIWNQPFFYKIEEAEAITIAYAPTDTGAKANYYSKYEKYKKDKTSLSPEQIYELLYNYKKEPRFNRNHETILTSLDIPIAKIAHIDMSCFPYVLDKYRRIYKSIDKSYYYSLKAIKLLYNQIKYILIDGKDNKEVVNTFFSKDFTLQTTTKLRINKGDRLSELSIYKHNIKEIFLIYFGTFLFGAGGVSNNCVDEIVKYVKDYLSEVRKVNF